MKIKRNKRKKINERNKRMKKKIERETTLRKMNESTGIKITKEEYKQLEINMIGRIKIEEILEKKLR